MMAEELMTKDKAQIFSINNLNHNIMPEEPKLTNLFEDNGNVHDDAALMASVEQLSPEQKQHIGK